MLMLEYTVTPKDVVAFNLHHAENSSTMRRQLRNARFVFSAATTITTLVICLVISRGQLALLMTIISVISGLFVYITYHGIVRRSIATQIRNTLKEGKNDSILGQQRHTITPEHISSETHGGSSVIKWSTIERIEHTDSYIFIYVNTLMAYIIPRHTFADDNEYQNTVNTLRTYHEASSNLT